MTNNLFIPPEPTGFLHRLPKCNIHTHLEGSIRPKTFLDLAQKQNISVPTSLSEIENLIQVNGDERSLRDYLQKITVNYQILKNIEALRRTAFEAAEDAYNDGVIYLELRAGPVTHTDQILTIEACIEAMLEGIHQAELVFDIKTRLIIAALRNHPPEVNTKLAKIAVRYREFGVVGFDLAGDEVDHPASDHKDACYIAKDGGLGLTIHAGEAAGPENVIYAIQDLQADRIGHGVHSIQSQAAIDLLKEKQVMLEICPTSNVHTKSIVNIESHPIRLFIKEGIPVSVNDDDPITSRTRVSKELMILQKYFHFNDEEIKALQINTLDHCFIMDENQRQALKTKIKEFNPF
ncbi:MAG: adenosine deaminase [Candidatus Kryptoniota bacterium]